MILHDDERCDRWPEMLSTSCNLYQLMTARGDLPSLTSGNNNTCTIKGSSGRRWSLPDSAPTKPSRTAISEARKQQKSTPILTRCNESSGYTETTARSSMRKKSRAKRSPATPLEDKDEDIDDMFALFTWSQPETSVTSEELDYGRERYHLDRIISKIHTQTPAKIAKFQSQLVAEEQSIGCSTTQKLSQSHESRHLSKIRGNHDRVKSSIHDKKSKLERHLESHNRETALQRRSERSRMSEYTTQSHSRRRLANRTDSSSLLTW